MDACRMLTASISCPEFDAQICRKIVLPTVRYEHKGLGSHGKLIHPKEAMENKRYPDIP